MEWCLPSRPLLRASQHLRQPSRGSWLLCDPVEGTFEHWCAVVKKYYFKVRACLSIWIYSQLWNEMRRNLTMWRCMWHSPRNKATVGNLQATEHVVSSFLDCNPDQIGIYLVIESCCAGHVLPANKCGFVEREPRTANQCWPAFNRALKRLIAPFCPLFLLSSWH